MSVLQKPIAATIEVAYSDVRKQDMTRENQKTCSLVINIIEHIFDEHNIKLNEILIPKNKKNNVDIYFEISFNSIKEMDIIKNEIMKKTVGSLSSLEILVDI